MILCVDQVLSAAEVDAITERLTPADFVDGTHSAGALAAGAKQNLQLPPTSSVHAALQTKVQQSLREHAVIAAAALPKTLSRVTFNRYDAGMHYGPHIDEPVIDSIRTDLSYTLFLSDPKTYSGGELVLSDAQGDQAIKLSAGSVVLYATGQRHEVQPVTAGSRLAAVGWIQSQVREASARSILFDLAGIAADLDDSQGELALRLAAVRANLRRRWTEL